MYTYKHLFFETVFSIFYFIPFDMDDTVFQNRKKSFKTNNYAMKINPTDKYYKETTHTHK